MDLFGTAGIRGPVEDTVTPSLALAVGSAAAADGSQWVVGRDGRVTGSGLCRAVCAGLAAGGAEVEVLGQVPTPVVGFASRDQHGIMVTASHNPPGDNGLKFFVDGSEYDSAAEQRLESRLGQEPTAAEWDRWSTPVRRDSATAEYRQAVIEYSARIGATVGSRTVAIDYGGGIAGRVGPAILTARGVDVHAINAHVDGHFSARDSEPTAASLRDLADYVASSPDIDIGIAHDGDGDRIAVLDAAGELVPADTITAILAEFYVRSSEVETPIVIATPNASTRIDRRVSAAGGRTERVSLGALHEGIADACRGENGRDDATDDAAVVFAAEPGKHIHPQFGGWIDALVSAAVLLSRIDAAGSLAALRADIPEPPTVQMNIDCPDSAKTDAMETITSRLRTEFSEASVEPTDGVRFSWADDHWLLVRPSGTEPYIRLYGEGEGIHSRAEVAVNLLESTVESVRSR